MQKDTMMNVKQSAFTALFVLIGLVLATVLREATKSDKERARATEAIRQQYALAARIIEDARDTLGR